MEGEYTRSSWRGWSGLRGPLRTLGLAFRLGWQLETNWTRPWIFAIYMLIKPVCGSLVLVCMFYAARAAVPGRVPADFLPYLYVSNAVFGLVGLVMFGLSYAVIRDREHYRMLKYIYISPGDFRMYILGRGLARAVEGIVGGALNIGVGVALFAELQATVRPDVGRLVVFLLLGAVLLWSCGVLLAGACLNMTRQGMFLSEGLAGVAYLLSGVIVPVTVLPGWLQPVALSLPTTYWIEGMRRALLGPLPERLGGPLQSWSDGELAGMLALTAGGLAVAAQVGWWWCVRRAWRRGLLEENAGV